MENLQQIDARVETYVLKRLQRMSRLAAETSVNGAPRQQNSGEFSPTARSHGERSKPFSLA